MFEKPSFKFISISKYSHSGEFELQEKIGKKVIIAHYFLLKFGRKFVSQNLKKIETKCVNLSKKYHSTLVQRVYFSWLFVTQIFPPFITSHMTKIFCWFFL